MQKRCLSLLKIPKGFGIVDFFQKFLIYDSNKKGSTRFDMFFAQFQECVGMFSDRFQ